MVLVLVRAMFGLTRKLYMVTRSFLKTIGQMLAMSFMKIMGLNLVTLNLYEIIGNFPLSIAIRINPMMKIIHFSVPDMIKRKPWRFNLLKPMGALLVIELWINFK